MGVEIGADAVGDDRKVGARVRPLDRDFAVRIGLLEFLKRFIMPSARCSDQFWPGRRDADEHVDRAVLREKAACALPSDSRPG